MAQVTYEEVVKLAEQLSPVEQQALIAHLQESAKHRKLTKEEWWALLDSATVSIPLGPKFSDRREGWYGDDGR